MRFFKTSTDGFSKIITLNALAFEYRRNNTDSAIYFAKEALALATMKNFKPGIAEAYLNIGRIKLLSGDLKESLENLNEALKLYDALLLSPAADKSAIHKQRGNVYNEIGKVWIGVGNNPEALKNLFIALKIREELKDKIDISYTQNNIGNIFLQQKNNSEALKYYSASLKTREEAGDINGIANSKNNIANIYFNEGNFTKALESYFICLKLFEEINDKPGIALSYSNIGRVMVYQSKIEEALPFFYKGLKLQEETGDKDGMAGSYIDIGNCFFEQKKFEKSRFYINKALANSKDVGSWNNLKYSYECLAELDSALGNYKQSLVQYKLKISYQDSLYNEESTKKLVQMQMQYDFAKKEDSLNQKHIITETKLQAEKKQKYFYWAGLFMLGLLSIFVFLNFRNQKRVNQLAGEAHARQKRELKMQNLQSILNERLRISSDLHDEVGATLSGIAMYSHLTKEQLKQNNLSGINSSLDIMQQNSSQMVDKLNDIVWFINPEQDTFRQLLTRLEDFTYKMAAIKDIKTVIKKPKNPDEILLATELRRNIYLFCKEAVNNAVKHSGATLLEFSVSDNNGFFEFEIKDNGRAFDISATNGGNGMDNMKKRAEALGGQMLVSSSAGSGTAIRLQLKIPR